MKLIFFEIKTISSYKITAFGFQKSGGKNKPTP